MSRAQIHRYRGHYARAGRLRVGSHWDVRTRNAKRSLFCDRGRDCVHYAGGAYLRARRAKTGVLTPGDDSTLSRERVALGARRLPRAEGEAS